MFLFLFIAINLDKGPWLEQAGDLHHRHRRVGLAEAVAPADTDGRSCRAVLIEVGHVADELHDMGRPAAGSAHHGDDVVHALDELRGER